MKYLEILKQYAFSLIIVLLGIYSAYVIWSLYSNVYAPLVLTSDATIATSKKYRIPDKDITAALEIMSPSLEAGDETEEIVFDEYSLGLPLQTQSDVSTEIPIETLPTFGVPN